MNRHDDICVCFHVSLQKIEKHVRLNQPKVASQISDCYGAGTGCGWCIPFLEKIFDDMRDGNRPDLKLTKEEYVSRRQNYRETHQPKNRFAR